MPDTNQLCIHLSSNLFPCPWIKHIPQLKHTRKWSSLSEFIKEIKQEFSRFYNKRHGRRGFFWGERFKSLIVENGETLVNCLAYIDLNPVRAGVVKRPEEYRWNSIGYHLQSGKRILISPGLNVSGTGPDISATPALSVQNDM